MDTRVVAVFVFLFLSSGYSLMQCNVDADDDILDILQETDNLKEAPAVREEQLEERSSKPLVIDTRLHH